MIHGNAALKGNGEDVTDNDQTGNNRLLSVAQVATEMGVSPKTVYGWTYREPRLPVERDGRRIFIASESLKLHRPGVEQTSVSASIPEEKDQVRAEPDLPSEETQENVIVATREMAPENPTCTSSGQRELIIRPRYGMCFAALVAPSFEFLR